MASYQPCRERRTGDVAATLIPPGAYFVEVRENARGRVRERYTYRHRTVALID